MIRALHSTLRSYIRLTQSNHGSQESLAWESLETFTTFRLPAEVDGQASIGFRVLWRILREILRGGSFVKHYNTGSSVVILDGSFTQAEMRREYVSYQTGLKPDIFLAKEHAVSGFRRSPIALLYFLLTGSFLALRCFILKKNRANRALHIRQLAENASLLDFIEQYQPLAIYHFSNCLIDNNWVYLLLYPHSKSYFRILSPYAMTTHNRITLTETLVSSIPYHLDELQVLPEVHYNSLVNWVPESAFVFMPRYLKADLSNPEPGTIGYYSHGSWVRHGLKNRSDNMGIDVAEEVVLSYLAEYIKKHHGLRLSIFLHPKEKKEPWFERAHEYYGRFFASDSFAFVDREKTSANSFELVDVGIAVFTSIMYERLFAGYKTLIGVAGLQGFPVDGSSLEGIVFRDYQGFENLLDQSVELTQKAFFEELKVKAYHHMAYRSFDHFKLITHGSE